VVAAREGERADLCDDESANDADEQKRRKQRPSDPPPVEDRESNADRDDARPNDIAGQLTTHTCILFISCTA